MKIKRSEVAKVDRIVTAFRSQGVPFWILSHEAHKLSNGLVGVPFSHKDQNKSVHITELALGIVRAEAANKTAPLYNFG
jgi:hypothetical protein